MSTHVYRYPGAQPFTAGDRRIFYGRETDTRRLAALIRLEQMVVLYGTSGLGKSSLLNAAVVPRLEESGETGVPPVFAVPLRFGSFARQAGGSLPPLQNVLLRLRSLGRPDHWTTRFGEAAPLWQALKSVQDAHPAQQPLLLFDQFEELFTYAPADVKAFASQLAQALYEQVPQPVRKMLENEAVALDDAERQALFQPLDLKIVFAIRSDRMSFLDGLKAYLPDILHKTYQLKPLNRPQAEDAILNPAYRNDPDFTVSPFDYTDEALDGILDFLSTGGQTPIESTQLQIICQHAERLVEEDAVAQRTQAGIPQVRPEDLGDLSQIFGEYYDNILAEITDEEERLKVRKLIEEDLIFEESKLRLPRHQDVITRRDGISQAILDVLVQRHHLLRTERSTSGEGFTYELSHDTLVAPILEAKQTRLAEERHREQEIQQREAEQRAVEAEAKAAEEAALRATADQGRRRANVFAGIALLLLALAITGVVFASVQQQAATEALDKANESLMGTFESQIKENGVTIGRFRRDRTAFDQADEDSLAGRASFKIDSLLQDNIRLLQQVDSLRAILPNRDAP